MVDISNKALAMVLVAAIVVSLGGTMVSLNKLDGIGGITARAFDVGVTNITIESDVSVIFTTISVDFGSGFANESTCDFNTDGINPSTPACANSSDERGFNTGLSPLVIENIGTIDAQLNLSFDSDAADFLGGTTPGFWYKMEELEGGSCTGLQNTAWTVVPDAADAIVCNTFEATGTDTLNIHFNLSIPEDADAGPHGMIVTATLLQ